MKLSIENIGLIKSSQIEINGITVIAGENGTGKSTVGKVLYCLFSAFHNIDEKIDNERHSLVYRALISPFRNKLRSIPSFARKLTKEICGKRNFFLDHPSELLKLLTETYGAMQFPGLEEADELFDVETVYANIFPLLKLADNTIKAKVLKSLLTAEFGKQIGHANTDQLTSSAMLTISGKDLISVSISNESLVSIEKAVNLYNNIAYIDDPFTIDEVSDTIPYLKANIDNHRNALVDQLRRKRQDSIVSNVMQEMVISDKLKPIYRLLDQICEGNLIAYDDEYAYASSKLKKPLPLANVSTGLKAFLIIKSLLTNGSIEDEGTIILDEPEIHLHPEWQLAFAELIVVLQQAFGLHILLTTHSPYFLRAIQVYSAKYGANNVCKYYLSEIEDEYAKITDVTENIERIYVKLSLPLQKLEDEVWQDD